MGRKLAAQHAPEQPTEPSQAWLAVFVLAATFAIAATVLIVWRGDPYPSDPSRWTPLQTAERFNQLYEEGRVAEFQGLVSPRAVWCIDSSCSLTTPFFGSSFAHETQTAHEAQFLAATHGTLGAECVANGPAVECQWHQSNLFFEVAGIDPWVGSQSFTVEEGVITHYRGGYRYEGVLVYDRPQQLQYSRWLEASYPAEHADLFEDQLMLVFSKENRDRHRELVGEWAASLGF